MIRPSRWRRYVVPRKPWTCDDDAKLAEMTALGVSCVAWPVQFPGRVFGDVAERRLELGLCSAPLL